MRPIALYPTNPALLGRLRFVALGVTPPFVKNCTLGHEPEKGDRERPGGYAAFASHLSCILIVCVPNAEGRLDLPGWGSDSPGIVEVEAEEESPQFGV
jgi:hypothetical protein